MAKTLRKYFSGLHEYLELIRHYGITGLFDEIRNRQSIWSLVSTGEPKNIGSIATSITDRPDYIDICKKAASDESVLTNYKRCREYRLVLEHVSRYQGEQYLEFIKNDARILENLINVSKLEIGNPIRHKYEKIGFMSPTQIRYAKILSDLEYFFGSLAEKIIVEVGVGNGGQAIQICNFENVKEFHLVDLPEVLALTAKAVGPYNISENLRFLTPEILSNIESDLFISNYAFSELKKPVQDSYIKYLVLKAKSGYMLYNHIHANQSDSYSVYEIQSMIPGSRILEEKPKTFKGNQLLVWGTSRIS